MAAIRTPFDQRFESVCEAGRWSAQEWTDFCFWAAGRYGYPAVLYREWFVERGAVQADPGEKGFVIYG